MAMVMKPMNSTRSVVPTPVPPGLSPGLVMALLTNDTTAPTALASPRNVITRSSTGASSPRSAHGLKHPTTEPYDTLVSISYVTCGTAVYAPGVAPLLEDVPSRALAVYAHPDDPEISCGGTLARWARAGTEVHALVCTRGDKGSSDPDVDSDALAERRVGEIAAAAEVLGLAGHDQLGVDDGELENTREVRAGIVSAIRRVRPDVVLCPDPTAVLFGDRYFNHRDHRSVGWAALDAAAPAAANPHYFPDAGPVHQVAAVLLSGTLDPNVWVDIGDTLDVKVEALMRHESQLGESGEWFPELVRERAEESGRQAGVRYAEGFRRLSLVG